MLTPTYTDMVSTLLALAMADIVTGELAKAQPASIALPDCAVKDLSTEYIANNWEWFDLPFTVENTTAAFDNAFSKCKDAALTLNETGRWYISPSYRLREGVRVYDIPDWTPRLATWCEMPADGVSPQCCWVTLGFIHKDNVTVQAAGNLGAGANVAQWVYEPCKQNATTHVA